MNLDLALSEELIALLALGGGLLFSTFTAVFVARRARARRRRELEGIDEDVSPEQGELDHADSPVLEETAPEAGSGEAAREAAAEPTQAETTAAPELSQTTQADAFVPDADPSAEAESAQPLRRAAQPSDETSQSVPGSETTVGVPTPRDSAIPKAKPKSVAAPDKKEMAPADGPDLATDDSRLAFKKGLARTRSGWVSRLGQIFAGKKEIPPDLLEQMERVLLTADIGIRTATALIEDVRSSLSRNELTDTEAVWSFLKQRIVGLLDVDAPALDFGKGTPHVLLVIGVNGTGKTTTIGKLTAKLKAEGKSVLLIAGDTFRAAAVEQLEVWASRTESPVVKGQEGADPASVIFEGIKRASDLGVDVVIADTAGRLHTKSNLMDELQKIRRVTGKAMQGAPHETWLVLDSTSGQNAISQAEIFTKAMDVNGIVLTKLDGTAKGGVILGISDQLGIPVRFVGVGEGVDDLRRFDAQGFADALLEEPDAATP